MTAERFSNGMQWADKKGDIPESLLQKLLNKGQASLSSPVTPRDIRLKWEEEVKPLPDSVTRKYGRD